MATEAQGARSIDPLDLRNLLELMPAPAVCALPDGSVELVNRAWLEYTGRSLQQLGGRLWQSTIHPDDVARFIDEWTVALACGKSFQTEARIRRADGQYHWFSIRKAMALTPTHGLEESSLRTLVACEDIDERKPSEAKLQRGEGLLQAFFENSPNLIFLKDPQGRYLYANKKFKKAFHISGEVRGKTDDELFSPEQAAVIKDVDRQVLQTGSLVKLEDVALYEDGPHTRIVQKFPLFNAEGEIYAIGGAVTDITDRKREESALRHSEENHRLVLETAPDAVISIDESGAILFANSAVARIFGHDPTELIGSPLTVLMPEYLRKLHENGFGRYLATSQRHIDWHGTELIGLHKNGREFPIEVSFGEQSRGAHKVFTGFIRDISERKQAEELRAAHARQIAVRADVSVAFGKNESLKTILGECSDAVVRHLDAAFARIWTLSDDGEMLELQASAGMYTHLDGPHSRIPMGQFKIGMIAQERKPHFTNDVLNDPRISDRAWAEREGLVSFAAYPLTFADRTIGVLAMFSRRPVTPETTEILASGADLIAHGIERKHAQQALQLTQMELARVSRLTTMGELAASIAHEVNQPLTAVINNSSACLRLLAAGDLKPEVLRRALEEIVADGTRASAVIARIRAFIKKAPAAKNQLDINDVIQEVLALAGRELSRHRVLVECQLTTPLPLVLADRVQLQQVLLNLIMNGVEAMTAVTNRPRSLRMQSQIDESGDLLIAVRDSGAGLGPEADRVFTPFFTTKANGMGMGLSISRSLIENHGGRLWAAPNIPHGAVFYFTLPQSGESLHD